MRKSAASASYSTPTSTRGANSPSSKSELELNQIRTSTMLFFSLTWQLAVVVLVPLIGGYELDQHFGTMPWWTLAGVALTILGVVGVLLRILASTNTDITASLKEKK